MNKILTTLITIIWCTQVLAVDIRTFGAVGDGKHIDSPAINAAIQAAAQQGETVVIPAGTWLCYSIRLQSGITLRLEKGAVLKAAPVTDSLGYDEAEAIGYTLYQDFGHSPRHTHLSVVGNAPTKLCWGDARACLEKTAKRGLLTKAHIETDLLNGHVLA